MFNISPNDILHIDFCQYEGAHYMVLVDRLTGYIGAEKTKDETTDEAIRVVKNWATTFGYPLKIISDRGGSYRDDFVDKLKQLRVKHKPSSSYHPQSNSLAERAVGSLKNALKKATCNITPLGLREILFQINSNICAQQTGSANERFLRRSVRNTHIPTIIRKKVDPTQLVHKRILNHEKRMKFKNTTNKVIYEVGDRVMIQDTKSRKFEKFGTISKQRRADSGEIVSYEIIESNGWRSYRHRKHLRRLQPEHDTETYPDVDVDSSADIPKPKSVTTRSMTSHGVGSHDVDTAAPGIADKGVRKSKRIFKRSTMVKKVSIHKEVEETLDTLDMGNTSSKDCEEIQKENEHLRTRVKLYEAGITDHSVHGSQMNIGLLNLASESNSGTSSCTPEGGLNTIEITGILLLTLLSLYVFYGWCVKYSTHRRMEKEKHEMKLMNRMKRNLEDTRLEIASCEKDNSFHA